jgi:hypothetical protein
MLGLHCNFTAPSKSALVWSNKCCVPINCLDNYSLLCTVLWTAGTGSGEAGRNRRKYSEGVAETGGAWWSCEHMCLSRQQSHRLRFWVRMPLFMNFVMTCYFELPYHIHTSSHCWITISHPYFISLLNSTLTFSIVKLIERNFSKHWGSIKSLYTNL